MDPAPAARRLWRRRRLSSRPTPGATGRRAPFAVRDRVRETADTWTLTLEPVDGEGPAIDPGQFVMVYAFGVGEVPISVSGAVGRPAPVVLTVRAVGAVTERDLRGRAAALCSASAGRFGQRVADRRRGGRRHRRRRGGIGLAPLRPVVLHALARRGGVRRARRSSTARARPPTFSTATQLEEWRRGRRDSGRAPGATGAGRSASCRSWFRLRPFDPRPRRRSCAGPR